MTPIDKLIALAEELDAKATRGPWGCEARFGFVPQWQVIEGDNLVCGNSVERENAEFIAASRTAWPATAKALKVAREALELCAKASLSRRATEEIEIRSDAACEALAEIDRIVKEGLGE